MLFELGTGNITKVHLLIIKFVFLSTIQLLTENLFLGDYKRFTDVYLWPSDKYPNSDYEKYGYDPSKILQSRTNRAIGKVYQRLKGKIFIS